MKRIFPLLALWAFNAFSETDDWFDVAPVGASLDLSLGQFEDGASLASISAQLPLFSDAQFYGRYTRLNSDYQRETGTSLYLQSNPYAKVTVGLGYENGNRDDSYEVEDFIVLLGTNISSWYLEANLIRGDVRTTPFGLDQQLVSSLREQGFLDASRTGIGLSMSYFAKSWALNFGYRDYQLDRDNEPTEENIGQLLRELESTAGQEENQSSDNESQENWNYREEWRNRFQQDFSYRTQIWTDMSAANQNYYWQVSHIADQEANADIYFYYKQYSFATGLYWYENARFEEQVSSVYGSIEYPLTNKLNIGLLLSTSDQKASFYSELGLGISW